MNAQNELLLIKRRKQGRQYWVFPGGGVEANESLEQAAMREALEEVSLNIQLAANLFQLENDGRIETYFLVNRFSGEMELGDGPERNKLNAENSYLPTWVKLNNLEAIELLPTQGKAEIARLYEENRL